MIGNHDMWALDGDRPEIWTSQGVENTIRSYGSRPMPNEHFDFLQSGQLWIELKDQVFVHGGFNLDISLSSRSAQTLVWDRTLLVTPQGQSFVRWRHASLPTSGGGFFCCCIGCNASPPDGVRYAVCGMRTASGMKMSNVED